MPPQGEHLRPRLRLVSAGESPPADLRERGELWLDTGGGVREGLIDHRHWPGFRRSSARLLVRNPELLEAAVPADGGEPVLVLRAVPSLDAIACAHLALNFLRTGDFGPSAHELVEYVDMLVAGHAGVSREHLFTLSAAHHTILRRYDDRDGGPGERWPAAVYESLRAIDHCADRVAAGGASFGTADAFAAPGLFGRKDRAWVEADLGRYRERLADPNCRARPGVVRLPGRFAPSVDVPGLAVRHVQDSRDENAVVFFKDWARSDPQAGGERPGFEFLCVYGRWSDDRPYAMLSLPPESGATLKGLSALLTEREREAQKKPARRPGPAPAPGPDDPARTAWTDGYGFTLVRSPAHGTALSADEVEDAVRAFGATAAVPAAAPAEPDWGNLEVFISYPRRRQEWVMSNVYAPLAAWRGPGRIFCDREALPAGGAWLPRLARGARECRHFLAVICPEYLQSEFCAAELSWALATDIQNRRQKVLPFVIDNVDALPDHCSHLQVVRAAGTGVPDQLRSLLRPLLGE